MGICCFLAIFSISLILTLSPVSLYGESACVRSLNVLHGEREREEKDNINSLKRICCLFALFSLSLILPPSFPRFPMWGKCVCDSDTERERRKTILTSKDRKNDRENLLFVGYILYLSFILPSSLPRFPIWGKCV